VDQEGLLSDKGLEIDAVVLLQALHSLLESDSDGSEADA